MKKCQHCKVEKANEEFNKNSSKPDGLQNRCRACTKSYNNQSYNSSYKRRASIAARNKKNVEFNREFCVRVRRVLGCKVCDENEPVALDFHHIDDSTKDNNVSHLHRHSIRAVKAEIRKCVVLCANCHRKVHAGVIEL